MVMKLNLDECVGCGNCTTACPLGLVEVRRGKVNIKAGCDFCGACAAACGYYVIKMNQRRPAKKGEGRELTANG